MTEPVPVFAGAPLLEILTHVQAALAGGATSVAFRVLDPDHGAGRHAGERVAHDGTDYVHRPFAAWVELADRLGLRLATPRPGPAPLVELRFTRLADRAGWHAAPVADLTEKYGASSAFARISKLEDPGFVLDFATALRRVGLGPRPRILDLGVNTGDELALIAARLPPEAEALTFVGVDHSASALAVARARFPAAGVRFVQADLGALADLDLGRFDLIVSIGTLQSPGIDDRAVLRRLVQHHLAPGGSLILGFPNCRYLDGEVQHGARMKNFREPELGLLVKDVAFYRKYLQQHGRQVHVTGSHYLLVTGVPAAGARAKAPDPDYPSDI